MTTTVQNVIRQAASNDDLYFLTTRSLTKFYQTNASKKPTSEQLDEAMDFIDRDLDVELSQKQLELLLQLSPRTRISLAVHGMDDTDVRGQVSDMVAQHYLGCDWPTYGDNVDLAAFREILWRQMEIVAK